MNVFQELPNFPQRKMIAKVRCSDHAVEIEKGRHSKIPREERTCRVCDSKEVVNEDHFLTKCKFYDNIKLKYQIKQNENSLDFLHETNLKTLGNYLQDAFTERKAKYETLYKK